jgi:hypothetical protein
VSARPALEVADIIGAHAETFLTRYGAGLTATQRRALEDLGRCRTAALGGHVERCADCGHERIAYNSCRNRHCPKCQASSRARWLEREASYLLPVEYHHVVFTLPPAVADLALANPALLYGLLFRAATQTLREVAADPHYLGAEVGVLAVLHTWGQNLHHHPHVHAVVTGGGLSCNARGAVEAAPRWVACRPGFFLPVRVLSRVFRGKFLAGLRELYAAQRLALPGPWAALAAPSAFAAWLGPLYHQEWVVYSKPPFGGPAQVLKYLARYTHRVALSNQRLLALDEGGVTFTWKDYAHGGKQRRLTLSADEFLRRFVQHVLPKGFVKVRHYGLLANRDRAAKLAVCRALLAREPLARATAAAALAPAAAPWERCPVCGGARLVRRPLPEAGIAEAAGPVPPPDTS